MPPAKAATRATKSAKSPKAAKSAKSPKAAKPAKTPKQANAKPAASKVARPAKRASVGDATGASEVTAHIQHLGGWRAQALLRMRKLILEAVPDAEEAVKWRKPSNGMQGVPTWSHAGLICTGEPYKDKVKFTFAHGAALPDPKGVFNGNDNGATRRSIDVREGHEVDADAFQDLVRAAARLNASS